MHELKTAIATGGGIYSVCDVQVRNTGVVWNDARRQLRQDPRWASMGLLEQEEKEHLFQDHCNNLAEKKRLQFRRLLEETSQVIYYRTVSLH